ncbi:hypothetical protein [Corynebacterium kalidii]|uniref:Uncharacterized protein n=1 Tax=Corynebacterium kalidii TaxID=2931982 RepID=A0A9X1WJK9_9CORY|nr:hypothetical protein [Corynebacterium kalidii]MCJ7859761.1 hypothetical protein [Corynebacterium kalidii]
MPRSAGPQLPNAVARQLRDAVSSAQDARDRATELRVRRNEAVRHAHELYGCGATELSRRSGLGVETVRAILSGRT